MNIHSKPRHPRVFYRCADDGGDHTRSHMTNKKIIWAGLAAGVLGHILQGFAAYLVFDRFYLENPELVRDSVKLVVVYYLALNMVVGLVIAHLAYYLSRVWRGPDWLVGIRAAWLIWAASSAVFVIKRQIILRLSNWLLLEIAADFIIYAVMGALAGFLVGRGIIEKKELT